MISPVGGGGESVGQTCWERMEMADSHAVISHLVLDVVQMFQIPCNCFSLSPTPRKQYSVWFPGSVFNIQQWDRCEH